MAERLAIGAREVRAILEAATQSDLDDRHARAAFLQEHARMIQTLLPDERRWRAACGRDHAIELTDRNIEVIGDMLRRELRLAQIGFDVVGDFTRAQSASFGIPRTGLAE